MVDTTSYKKTINKWYKNNSSFRRLKQSLRLRLNRLSGKQVEQKVSQRTQMGNEGFFTNGYSKIKR